MSDVQLLSIQKNYGKGPVIHNIDLRIASGSFTVFVGPSGCGKTTLLRMIAGLESVSSGDLLIADERVNDLPPSQRGIAMVFQSYALYPHMTVFDNMSFSLSLAKVSKEEIKRRVHEAAEILQITSYLQRLPKALSGGQRQRVAIGRAIVRQPRVFLFDEPLSNLDAALRTQMRVELASLHNKLGTTMVYVTHDQIEAMTLADSIVVLNQGKLEQVGSPMELYEKPVSKFVAGFIGSPKMNFFQGNIAQAAGAHSIGVRPEHLKVCAEHEAKFTGVLKHAENLGNETFAYIDTIDNGQITMRTDGQLQAKIGQPLYLSFAEQHTYRFSADSMRI